MAVTNHERVGKALELLRKGLLPFFQREMQAKYGENWLETALQSIKDKRSFDQGDTTNWDVHNLLVVMWEHWNDVFRTVLGQSERTLVSELRETRNKWAHQKSFSSDDVYRALDSIERLLTAISAPEANDIQKQKMEILRTRFDEQRRGEMRKTGIERSPSAGLKPWRQIVTPHPDVASGKYQDAEFAADLWQVYHNRGSDEYKDPTEFFRRTYLTDGLKNLLTSAVERLNGSGGDPVVELQTNFGGGKTHSLLALFHLFSGKTANQLPGIDELLANISINLPPKVHRTVFVGTQVSPGNTYEKPDGTIVKTLWGEIAWQLGGKEGYRLVEKSDETATNPGDMLQELFKQYSPCLVLIDEWVGYARQLHDEPDLPGGSFDTQFTFAQAITEAAKASPQTMVVISIPESDKEAGGERGKAALARLKNIVSRVESSWRPASQDESFEIVRRRLFQPIVDNQLFIQRDAAARAFSQLYSTQSQEFPSHCKEADYERRIKSAYPIHPELFDRLYSDWSTLENFHRTRGVLRLMAAVIHALWESNDNNLLILPAAVPLNDPNVLRELNRSLEEQWTPVIEKDVDGTRALPVKLDKENPNLGRYSACRRAARTIYMGSAPIHKAANKGIDDNQVKLGCVQPGESPAIFGDALRLLGDRATYLYLDGHRYWYSTQPTVTRLAGDRAGQFLQHDIFEEIARRLRLDSRQRGDFAKVHPCVPGRDIPDEPEARLVILGPDFPHTNKDTNSPARREAQNILDTRGIIPRKYRNSLVFLAVDQNRLTDLENAIRQFMAWESITRECDALNLDPFQANQAKTQCQRANDTVNIRIPEAYQWLIVPQQPEPKGDMQWEEKRLQGQDALAVQAAKKLANMDMLFTQFGGIRLRMELDRIPLWRGDHVGIKQLSEDFARYLYLPRLKDINLLITAIQDGISQLTWETDTFAYAQDFDPETGYYPGLAAGKQANVWIDDHTVVVKSETAMKQIQEQKAGEKEKPGGEGEGVPGTPPGKPGEEIPKEGEQEDKKPKLRRFYAAVELDANRISRDAQQIAEEVLQHLTKLESARVEVSLEIQAYIPKGASEEVIRTVTENCRTLKFSNYDFEEE
jgi:hypothetical protein